MPFCLDLINDVAFSALKIWMVSGCVLAMVGSSRNCSAHTLHQALFLTLLASILIPVLAVFLPTITLPLLPAPLADLAEVRWQSANGSELLPAALVVYLLVVTTMLAHLAGDLWRLRGLQRRAHSLAASSLPAGIDLQAITGRPVKLLSSPELEVPVTWGHGRPKLALPDTFRDWPSERLRHTLMHELAHIQRGDWLFKLFAHLAVALLWPLPSVWRLRSKMFWYAEVACDDRVLRSGVSRADYAASLLSFASRRLPKQPGLRLIDPSRVFQRIDCVLDGTRIYHPDQRLSAALALLAFAAVLPLSALTLTPWTGKQEETLRLVPLRIALPATAPVSEADPDQHEIDLRGLKSQLLELSTPPPDKPTTHWSIQIHPRQSHVISPAAVWQPEVQQPEPAWVPRRIKEVAPAYPPPAIIRGIEGEVIVEFEITPAGTVAKERVVTAQPVGVFEQAALKAVRQFRYTPAIGQASPSQRHKHRGVFRFQLDAEK